MENRPIDGLKSTLTTLVVLRIATLPTIQHDGAIPTRQWIPTVIGKLSGSPWFDQLIKDGVDYAIVITGVGGKWRAIAAQEEDRGSVYWWCWRTRTHKSNSAGNRYYYQEHSCTPMNCSRVNVSYSSSREVQSALIARKATSCCCENDKADAGIRKGVALSTNQR